MNNFTQWPWLAGIAAMFTVIAATWRQCVGILRRIGDMVICRVIVKDEACQAVMSFVWERGRRSPFGLRAFGGVRTYVNPRHRVEVVGYECVSSDPMLLWFRGRPVIVSRPQHKEGGTNIGNTNTSTVLNAWFIRGTFDVDKFVSEAIELYNQMHRAGGGSKRRRFIVQRLGRISDSNEKLRNNAVPSSPSYYGEENIEEQLKTKSVRLIGWRPDQIGVQPDDGAFSGYAFPEKVMEALSEIRTWIDNEKWFRSKGIPWRRGWLLHGPPGSGKSTLIRSIGMEFDLPVYVLDLTSLDNESLSTCWQEMQQNAPAIALIEDIDAVFHGRENVAAKNTTRDPLTFDCLLNTISGVGNSDGVFLCVTTNHPEKLDKAIGVPQNGNSTRPGRIDRVIHLGLMDEPERIKIAQHILGDFPDLIEPTVNKGDQETAAQFQHRCATLAMAKFWEGR